MIKDSELILNDRKGIYHIDMRNDELADIVITVGDQDRVDKVCQFFDHIEHQQSHREFRWKTGQYAGKNITVISTGIGPDNIDIVLNELDAVANIDFETRSLCDQHRQLKIIRLGTTGGLDENIPVDTPVISAMAVGLDNLMHYYQHHHESEEQKLIDNIMQLPSFSNGSIRPYATTASDRLLNLCDEQMLRGITLTAPGFYGPQGRVLRAQLAHSSMIDDISSMKNTSPYDFTNFEMETSAILGLSKILGHEAIAISVIIANRKTGVFSKNIHVAIEDMIKNALESIKEF